jgi:hypothetical protein
MGLTLGRASAKSPTLPSTERQWLEFRGAWILTNVTRPSRVRSAGRLYHLDIDHDTGVQNATIAGSVRSLPATKARHHNVARRSAGDKR